MDLEQLNKEQKETVLYNDGPLVVLSSAGSGKTRCITTKISHLLNNHNIRPTRIFAVTFTNKAAQEMKERLIDMVGEKGKLVRMSTIHSLAYRIFRDAKRIKEPWFDLPKPMANTGKVLGHLFKFCKSQNLITKDARVYLSEIADLKMGLINPDTYRQQREALNRDVDWLAPDSLSYQDAIYLVYVEYEKWKQKRNFIDFSDMLVECYNVLTSPKYSDFVEQLQNRVEYLLVDECQDTNYVSFLILKILGEKYKRITLLGDLRQAIYSFNGARIENMREFINDYNPQMINLKTNYRSTETIVQNANKLISYSQENLGEPAITPNETGEKITVLSHYDNVSEGEGVFDLIQGLVEYNNVPYKNIAVLYRVHSQARELEDHLVINEVPFISYAKTTFYKRKEILDLISYLKLFLSPEKIKFADISRIANRPVRFISNQCLSKLEDFADELEVDISEILKSVWDHNFTTSEAEKLDSLYSDIQKLRKECKGKTTEQIFEFVLNDLNYKKWALNDKKGKGDVDDDLEFNFESLVSSVRKFPNPLSLLSFIEDLKKKEKLKKDENGDYIKLMSVHAAKGKEFENVIILGACNRIYPFYKSVQEGKLEEERRVMYVALTRPKKKLYISEIRAKYGNFNVEPCHYLKQMNLDKSNYEFHN